MPFSIVPRPANEALILETAGKCNALSERFGLSLTTGQMEALERGRCEALESTGRIELGEGVITKLVYAFCDSPYILRESYFETLLALQDDFYAFKNELDEQLSDDELIEGMRAIYHGKAQGSLEYLENVSLSELYRAALGKEDPDDDE